MRTFISFCIGFLASFLVTSIVTYNSSMLNVSKIKEPPVPVAESNIVKPVLVVPTKPKPKPLPPPLLVKKDVEAESIVEAVSRIYKNIDPIELATVVDLVYHHAKVNGIPPVVGVSIIAIESSFKQNATSPTGTGYTQVYTKYHQDKIAGRDIYDPTVNVEVGMKILGGCLSRFKSINRALACYNGAITPEKADRYIRKVVNKHNRLVKMASSI